jgi:hypothetical protein
MNRSFIGVSVLLVALVMLPLSLAFADGGVPAGTENSPSTLVTGQCKKASNIDFAVDDSTGNTTSSTTFVDVPGMSVTFNLGRGSNCVKIEYSAYVFAAVNAALMNVQAVMDGVACSPADVQFSGDDDENANGSWARSHAFNFVCTGLAQGIHTAKIQWRSFFGDTIFTHKRSMYVHHK